MSVFGVTIQLDRHNGLYRPGETLSGGYHIAPEENSEVRMVELSVLWYTTGPGNEDLGVHHFERLTSERDNPIDTSRLMPFSTRLPASPLSYDGLVVKINWCVRVRVFLSGDEELLGETEFRLGEVAQARDSSDADPS